MVERQLKLLRPVTAAVAAVVVLAIVIAAAADGLMAVAGSESVMTAAVAVRRFHSYRLQALPFHYYLCCWSHRYCLHSHQHAIGCAIDRDAEPALTDRSLLDRHSHYHYHCRSDLAVTERSTRHLAAARPARVKQRPTVVVLAGTSAAAVADPKRRCFAVVCEAVATGSHQPMAQTEQKQRTDRLLLRSYQGESSAPVTVAAVGVVKAVGLRKRLKCDGSEWNRHHPHRQHQNQSHREAAHAVGTD